MLIFVVYYVHEIIKSIMVVEQVTQRRITSKIRNPATLKFPVTKERYQNLKKMWRKKTNRRKEEDAYGEDKYEWCLETLETRGFFPHFNLRSSELLNYATKALLSSTLLLLLSFIS